MHEGEAKPTLFETAFRDAAIGMACVSLDGRWLEANDALCALLGHTREQLLGSDVQLPVCAELAPDVEQRRALLEGTSRSYQVQKHCTLGNGDSLSALLTVWLVRAPEGTPSFFFVQAQEHPTPAEPERRVAPEEPTTNSPAAGEAFAAPEPLGSGAGDDAGAPIAPEPDRQASPFVDALTGLHNRPAFFLLADQALRAAARYERWQLLCFLDLDGLKEINDALGREQGDFALSDLAELLKRVFRRCDILARIGDDEFVALAEGDDSAESSLLQRMGDALDQHNALASRPYFLAASLGLAYWNPRRPVSLHDLLLEAERQMREGRRHARRAAPQPPAEESAP